METSRKLVQALGLLSLMVSGPAAMAAETLGQSLDRVEVQAAPVLRHDVTRSCPSVQADLQAALDKAITRHQIEGSYPVVFELKDHAVVQVSTQRLPDEYRLPIRRAVRSLDCQDVASTQAPQRFGFWLDVSTDDTRRDSQTARLSLRPLQVSQAR